MTRSYKHAVSDPRVLLARMRFHASAMEQATGIHRVYELARNKNLPQLDLATKIADAISSAPPDEDSYGYLASYLRTHVLSQIPNPTRYDDTFWCCLLHLLDQQQVPECQIGGPLHEFIYRVYDDFDPQDVLE